MSLAKLSPQARVDLLEIWHYIAKSSIQNANTVWDDIKAAINKVAETPGLGHTRSDVEDTRLRFWLVHSYLVVYLPNPKPIRIVRVVSGYRDFTKLFKN